MWESELTYKILSYREMEAQRHAIVITSCLGEADLKTNFSLHGIIVSSIHKTKLTLQLHPATVAVPIYALFLLVAFTLSSPVFLP